MGVRRRGRIRRTAGHSSRTNTLTASANVPLSNGRASTPAIPTTWEPAGAEGRLSTAIHLEEGSGISRNDRFTARGLAKVLELFRPPQAKG